MKIHAKRSKYMTSQKGFTLIEILIVVMVLGILAMIIVPQINVSTSDAKESTLSTNIMTLRNAIELYYHQHDSVYPGAVKIDGSASPTAAEAATAFEQQLTRYTEVDGTVSDTKTADAKYGPYLKNGALPTNPFNEMTTVLCDIATDDITSKTSDNTTGWKFYVITGNLMANDGDHDDL